MSRWHYETNTHGDEAACERPGRWRLSTFACRRNLLDGRKSVGAKRGFTTGFQPWRIEMIFWVLDLVLLSDATCLLVVADLLLWAS